MIAHPDTVVETVANPRRQKASGKIATATTKDFLIVGNLPKPELTHFN